VKRVECWKNNLAGYVDTLSNDLQLLSWPAGGGLRRAIVAVKSPVDKTAKIVLCVGVYSFHRRSIAGKIQRFRN
jgi:hypothetical protein